MRESVEKHLEQAETALTVQGEYVHSPERALAHAAIAAVYLLDDISYYLSEIRNHE